MLVGVRAFEAWRSFRRLRRTIGKGLLDTTRRLEAAEERLGRAGDVAQRLDRARAQLEDSLATAAVLVAAAGEARHLAARLRGVVPRK